MRMSKANKIIAKRGMAFLLSLLLCIGCIGTNWLGLLPGSSEGVTAKMHAYAVDYVAGTYYDAGTFKATDGNISDVNSAFKGDATAVTLNSTGLDFSGDEGFKGMSQEAGGDQLADYKAPMPRNEEYYYIAKGTATRNDASGKVDMSWEVYAWPKTTSADKVPTEGNNAEQGGTWTLPTTVKGAEDAFKASVWNSYAPKWESGAENYFDWSHEGVYNTITATGTDFKYGSNALIWSGSTSDDGYENVFWSLINTQPVKWGITPDSWNGVGGLSDDYAVPESDEETDRRAVVTDDEEGEEESKEEGTLDEGGDLEDGGNPEEKGNPEEGSENQEGNPVDTSGEMDLDESRREDEPDNGVSTQAADPQGHVAEIKTGNTDPYGEVRVKIIEFGSGNYAGASDGSDWTQNMLPSINLGFNEQNPRASISNGTIYADDASAEISKFVDYLNSDRGHSYDAVTNMSTWSLPAFDAPAYLQMLYSDSKQGVEARLGTLASGKTIGIAVKGATSGFTAEDHKLYLDGNGDVGFRIYGVQSAVYVRPYSLWYGLKANGTGGYAYDRGTPACYVSDSGVLTTPWEEGHYRYGSIHLGTETTNKYVDNVSWVHGYVNGRQSSFVYTMDETDGSGLPYFGTSTDIHDAMKKSQLYTAYDDHGYKTTDTLLDSTEDGGHIVNSHAEFEIRSQVYFDITDDSQRLHGTMTTTRDLSGITLNTDATASSGVAKTDSVITDIVDYSGLEVGETYTLKSEVVDLATGNVVAATSFDKELKVVAGTDTTNLVIKKDSASPVNVGIAGTFKVEFPAIDVLTGMTGTKEYSVRQTITNKATSSIKAEHGGNKADFPNQTVTYTLPAHVLIKDTQAEKTNVEPTTNTVIKDTVTYEGLVGGKTYALVGDVYKKSDFNGTALKAGATPVATGRWTLTASDALTDDKIIEATGDTLTVPVAGSVKVTFSGFDAKTGLDGTQEYVVHQRLYEPGNEANSSEHGDANTPHQIVAYTYLVGVPHLTTTAVSKTGRSSYVNPAAGDAIVDTVAWSGLEPGTYDVLGSLYVKRGDGTGDAIGNTSVRSTKFTVNSHDETGNFTMEFPITDDVINMAKGKDIVVVQTLYKYNGNTPEPILNHNDMNDAEQTVHMQSPTVLTDLTGASLDAAGSIRGNGTKSMLPVATTYIADYIQYAGLVPGNTYESVTTIVYASNGEVVRTGSQQAVFSHTFTASTPTRAFTMGMRLDNMQDLLYGRDVVAYNELYWVNGTTKVPVASEKDLKNTRQTMSFTSPVVVILTPELDTLAQGSTSGSGWSNTSVQNSANAKIQDIVNYKNLTVGQTYVLTGTLYNKAEDRPIPGVDTVAVEFKPTSSSGSVTMTFTLDTRALGGMEIYVGESLSVKNGNFVTEHRDKTDADQTVKVANPTTIVDDDDDEYIDTKAENGRGGKTIQAEKEAKVYDTVYYYNLTRGRTYKLEGEMRDQVTGKAIGDKVTLEFSPEKSNGSVEMTFTFDASDMGGRKVVVYETLYRGSTTVAYHRSLTDADQTVTVNTPAEEVEDLEIKTVATDTKTGSHTMFLSKEAVIQDVVTYTGAITGREYTLTATVMDKTTNAQAAGIAPVTVKFTASGPNGNTLVNIPVNTPSLIGHTLVVYETVSYGGKTVASHQDMNDADQTVYVASASTVLTSVNGGKTVAMSNGTTVRDTVNFTGLTPGKTYTVTGYIIDKTGPAQQTVKTTSETQGTQATPAPTAPAPAPTNSDGEAQLEVGGGTPQPQTPDSESTIVIDEGRRQANAQSITLADGTVVTFDGELVATGTASFTPSATSGSINVDFSVNTTGRTGHELVCLEVITDNGVPIATHADLNDANQTVTVRTTVNVQTGASPFGLAMTVASVLMMMFFGIYTVQAIVNRKRFEE